MIKAWLICMSLPPKIMSQGGMALSFPTLVTAGLRDICTFFNEDFEFSVHHEILRNVLKKGWDDN
jgi:hypothetical protein